MKIHYGKSDTVLNYIICTVGARYNYSNESRKAEVAGQPLQNE
jgi:hypothetical protein